MKEVPPPEWFYYLRNASDVPVYDLVVLFRVGEKGESLGTDSLDVLPPGEAPVAREIPPHVEAEARSVADVHGQTIRPLLSFRDSAGVRWRRLTNGILQRS